MADFFNGLAALFDLLTPKRSPEERAEAKRAALQQVYELRRAERKLAWQELRAARNLNHLYEFNAGFQYGGIPGLYQSYRPRLGLRVGAVSWAIRYGLLTEERVQGRDSYQIIDWQILQVNAFNTPQGSWRLGIGFMRGENNKPKIT